MGGKDKSLDPSAAIARTSADSGLVYRTGRFTEEGGWSYLSRFYVGHYYLIEDTTTTAPPACLPDWRSVKTQ